MKKLIILVLALVCVLGLVGCNTKSMNYIIENKPSVIGVVEEVHNDYVIMYSDTAEGYPNGSTWQISLDAENKDSYTDLSAGDEIVVYHDGNVMETDPLMVGTVYAITLKTPAEPKEDMSEIPGGTRFIIEIRDRTEEEQLACAEAEELFYEDETNRYYFNVIKSHYIMVTYNNSNSEDIAAALNAGRATIADLDEFGIEYHTGLKK